MRTRWLTFHDRKWLTLKRPLTPANQGLLWYHRKRLEDPDMDCYLRLCPRGYREENPETGPKPLHNSTDSEHHSLRENTNFSGTFKCKLHKQLGPYQQPVKFIRLTLGQQ